MIPRRVNAPGFKSETNGWVSVERIGRVIPRNDKGSLVVTFANGCHGHPLSDGLIVAGHWPVLNSPSQFSILRRQSLFVLCAHRRQATHRNQTQNTGAERDAVGERDPQAG